ncbi:GON-4-like protein [Brachyistius frenatus]|uniref:GON-4-like protein n=1 Tax=Brachyistius frenatus TaxID=100188 RepID=UPI0037E76F8F
MEGSCDPPKLVSQFLLRKTLVQVRRRILQCCRPGFPDNVVKTFRYQRLLRSMPVACRRVDPAEQRPPVEREESLMPLWLLRSLPIIYLTVKHYNSLPGSAPEAPPPCRWGGAVLRSAFSTYSFPPGTRYPPRLPDHLDFRRIGFVLKPLPTPLPESASSASPGPGAVSPPRLLLTRTDTASFTVSTATSEQIRCHCEMLAGLRRRRLSSSPTAGKHILYGGGATSSDDDTTATPPRQGSASSQVMGDDVIRTSDEEEEEGDVLLALSESSPSTTGSVAHDDSLEEAELERGQEVTPLRASENEEGGTSSGSRAFVLRLQEQQTGGDEDEGGDDEGDDDDEEDQRESEDMLFAQDYLHRVCEAVQVCPGLLDQLLQVLDGSGSVPEVLLERLRSVLRPWPQLIRDFAAFLNQKQARRCGLLAEQQLFERSRRFLRRLGRSLGEGSSLYQQVVSVLQGSSAPSSADLDEVSSLLRNHPDLQQEVRHLLLLHPSPLATSTPHCNRKRVHPDTGSDQEEEEEDDKVSMMSSGEKISMWTREADRSILMACQQGGANQNTFRQVSNQLRNKTVQQVRLRFQNLMKLFHSASQKSTSCSWPEQPISRQEAAPD